MEKYGGGKKRKNGRGENGLHVNVQQKEATFKGILPCKRVLGSEGMKRKVKRKNLRIRTHHLFCRPSHERECINRILIDVHGEYTKVSGWRHFDALPHTHPPTQAYRRK